MLLKRRTIEHAQETLILHIPFNGDYKDYSGNNRDLAKVSYEPEFVNFGGRKVFFAKNDATGLLFNAVPQINYINNCRFEFDFYQIAIQEEIYHNIIDGRGAGSRGVLTEYNFKNSNYFFGISTAHDQISSFPVSSFPVGKWLRYTMEKRGTHHHNTIFNIDDNIMVFEEFREQPVLESVDRIDVIIGRGSFSDRQSNGYLKELKIYGL